ncbi:MAG: murein biosynthesis integral membrane protein MurJ [Verrucomicrobia bacterium]|jgi:putative peptidoglycan lipid II flippase|nr:murein biosynthesis integral membrane protein MurJ [Verrucomicrobiota bacterium]MBT7068979.1 murein biosynthesis integral membrane protein MurJ [Verrucomicrobiota bacterium]MBT7702002.1 murein biosynthesis integral membrane protein MurJ [Verrucomicrobiota bacterium]
MKHRVFKSTIIVSLGTGVSRVLGLCREVLMAHYFGTSLAKSAFDVAFSIPNLFRRLFGEGALSAALVPVLTKTTAEEGREAAKRLVGQVMTLMGVVLLSIVALGVLGVSLAIEYGSWSERVAAVLPLLRIMLPYAFFICMVAICMAILNSQHHFALPAFTPVALNVVWILVILFLCRRYGSSPGDRIRFVAWGIIVAGVVQLAIQVPGLLQLGLFPRFSLAWSDAKVRRILLLMGPAALGMGIHQVNFFLDRILALWAAGWAPAALTFAERLVYLPLGIFATALGTVLLPTFSRQALHDDPSHMIATFRASLHNLMLLMIPAAVGLLVLARPIVDLVYAWEGGEFDARSGMLTARALAFYAPGLVVFSLYKLLVPLFYALEDTRTPVRVATVMVGLNLVLNVTFVLTWPLEFKHGGLALATVLASTANCICLGVLLQRRIGALGWRRLAGGVVRMLLAALAMAWVVMRVPDWMQALGGVAAGEGKLAQLLGVVAAMAVGVVIYGALLPVLRIGRMRADPIYETGH